MFGDIVLTIGMTEAAVIGGALGGAARMYLALVNRLLDTNDQTRRESLEAQRAQTAALVENAAAFAAFAEKLK